MHPSLRSLSRKIQRSVNINFSKLSEWIKGGIMHYMDTSSRVYYDITIQQGLSPVRKAINLINLSSDRRGYQPLHWLTYCQG